MQVQKSSKPHPQTPITGTPQGAPASASVSTKSSGAATAQQKQVVQDGYVAARHQPSPQSTSFVKVGTRPGADDSSAGRMECCLPPPPQKLPIGNEPPVTKAKREVERLQTEYYKTMLNAISDRNITDKEQSDINNASRNLKVAETNLELERAKQAYDVARREAAQRGWISPQQQKSLDEKKKKIDETEKRLAGLENEDLVKDLAEGRFDEVYNRLRDKFPWFKSEKLAFPPSPDFPKPPQLDYRPLFATN